MKSLKQFRFMVTPKKELTVLYWGDEEMDVRTITLKVFNKLNKKEFRKFDIPVPEQEKLI